MTTDHLDGLAVLSIAGGEQIGAIVRTYVDGPAKRIAGFAVRGGRVFSGEAEVKVDAAEVRALGPDALLVDDKTALRGTATNRSFGEWLTTAEVVGRPVLSVGGEELGHVAALGFDEHSFALTQIAVSRGVLKGTTLLPIERVVAIGRDLVVVADSGPAAPAHHHEDLPGHQPRADDATAASLR